MSMSSVSYACSPGVQPLPPTPFRTTIAHYLSKRDDEHACSGDKGLILGVSVAEPASRVSVSSEPVGEQSPPVRALTGPRIQPAAKSRLPSPLWVGGLVL